jgi:hypothetical protein
MCQFNFLVTNEFSDEVEIKSIASEIGLNYLKQPLKVVGFNQMNAYSTTRTSCDCGSVIGKNFRKSSSELDLQKEKKKLERKKFSKRRIELLLEQKQKEFAEKNSKIIEEEILESTKWIEFITDPRLKKQFDKIGILYHHFSGRLEDEQIRIEFERQSSTEKLNVDFLKAIQENEIVWVKLK